MDKYGVTCRCATGSTESLVKTACGDLTCPTCGKTFGKGLAEKFLESKMAGKMPREIAPEVFEALSRQPSPPDPSCDDDDGL